MNRAGGLSNRPPNLGTKKIKRFLRKLDIAFGQEYREKQLGRIRQLNEDLDILVSGGTQRTSTKGILARGISAASRYQRVQTHATAIYQVMKEMFQTSICLCEVSNQPDSYYFRRGLINTVTVFSGAAYCISAVRGAKYTFNGPQENS